MRPKTWDKLSVNNDHVYCTIRGVKREFPGLHNTALGFVVYFLPEVMHKIINFSRHETWGINHK